MYKSKLADLLLNYLSITTCVLVNKLKFMLMCKGLKEMYGTSKCQIFPLSHPWIIGIFLDFQGSLNSLISTLFKIQELMIFILKTYQYYGRPDLVKS